MGVYGDQLAFFPELFRKFALTEKKPEVNKGLVTITGPFKVVSGVLTTLRDSVLQSDSMTYVAVERRVFYTRNKIDGRYQFIVREKDDVLFRLSKSKDFVHEGNFYCYTLESVSGLTDDIPDTPNVVDPRSQFQ